MDLQRVVRAAAVLYPNDILVLEGARSMSRQIELVAARASQTLRSRHIADAKGVVHAVDLGILIGGELRWDWPLYENLSRAVKMAARNELVAIEWGGDWQHFKDGPHYQLPWEAYPMAGPSTTLA